jgi:hypothetical protein
MLQAGRQGGVWIDQPCDLNQVDMPLSDDSSDGLNLRTKAEGEPQMKAGIRCHTNTVQG